MKLSDIVSAAGLSWYAEVALVLFMLAFVLVLWRVFKPSLKAKYERAARLPLDDEHCEPPRNGTV
ncbi:MAG TPA: cbb3-type cytochrome c oxidase subunit 3 [Gemmatimonadaceae bacterium]|jgi:cbb3-type cytochrome oxidase subunit 3